MNSVKNRSNELADGKSVALNYGDWQIEQLESTGTDMSIGKYTNTYAANK